MAPTFSTLCPISCRTGLIRWASCCHWHLPSRDLRQTLLSAYAQDDFRLTAHFTLNLGVRYETTSVPTEIHGRLSNLRNFTDTAPHLGDEYFSNPTRLNFEPRIGFAWDAFGNERAVIRSGFGIFDVLPLPYEFELTSLFAAPFYQFATPTNLPPSAFPTAAVNIARSASIYRYAHIQPDPHQNYVSQWNFNLEFRTSRKSTLLVGYVGSRGIHQPFRADDVNIVLPSKTPRGYLWPSPTGSGSKMLPTAGRVDGLMWIGDSYYDALQVRAIAQPARGLNLQASYTWGKSIDTGSATIAGDQFANSVASLPWFDLRLSRGRSDFNTDRTLSVHGTYEIPTPHLAVMTRLLGGWRLNGTYQASTGAPFTHP